MGQFGLISYSETLYKYDASFSRKDGGVIPSSFFRFTEMLEPAGTVYEGAAILLTPVLELIAQMSGLRFRLTVVPLCPEALLA